MRGCLFDDIWPQTCVPCLAVGGRLRAHRSLLRWERCAYGAEDVCSVTADGRAPVILANKMPHQNIYAHIEKES